MTPESGFLAGSGTSRPVTPMTASLRLMAVLTLIALAAPRLRAQDPAPLFETRGVWFAPALGDGGWPVPGADAVAQEAALRDRIRAAHAMGLNTFVLQVTDNGDALFPSDRLPRAPHRSSAGIAHCRPGRSAAHLHGPPSFVPPSPGTTRMSTRSFAMRPSGPSPFA